MMRVLFQLVLASTLLSCVAGTGAQAAEERRGPALLQPRDVSVVVPQSALEQQYEFLVRAGATEVTYGSTGFVLSVTGPLNVVLPNLAALQPGDSAPSVLEALAPVTLTTGTETLKVARNSLNEEAGTRSVVFDQLIRDLPVFLAGMELTVDESSGVVRRFRSRVIPDRGLPAQPKITAARSVELATTFLEEADWAENGSVQVEKKPWLGYFAGAAEAQKPTLVWAINLSYVSPDRPPPARARAMRSIQVYIDAIDGQFRGETSMSSHAPKTA